MSEFVEHVPCDKCGSSDANGIYTDGHQYCFSCQTYVKGDDEASTGDVQKPKKTSKPTGLLEVEKYQSLTRRQINTETCQKYGYALVRDHRGKLVQAAPYRDQSNKVVAQKIRGPNKEFYTTGKFSNVQLFGQHLWKSSGGKRIVITEGEIDAMAAYQMLHSWPVVSIPNGAQGAVKAIQTNLEFVESYKDVILCFDMDEDGQEAAREVAELITPGKTRIMSMSEKDAGDMLVENKVKEFTSAFYEAKTYEPDGIINGADVWDLVDVDAEMGIEYPWPDLNDVTYGQRPGELYTWTSGTGMGKSEFVAEVAYDLLVNKGETVGYVALEENCGRTGKRMVAKALGVPIHLPGYEVDREQKKRAFERSTGNGRFYMYDHWGSQESHKLLSKIRFMIKAHQCDTIILDHLSIVVSGIDDGDERKAIDVIMTQLRALVEETGVKMHLVSHLRRPSQGKGHENGAQVSLSQLRGSHAIVQLSDFVFGLERDQQDEDNPNLSGIRVLKNRYSGDTGLAAAVQYDKDTGRILPASLDEIGGCSNAGYLSDETSDY